MCFSSFHNGSGGCCYFCCCFNRRGVLQERPLESLKNDIKTNKPTSFRAKKKNVAADVFCCSLQFICCTELLTAVVSAIIPKASQSAIPENVVKKIMLYKKLKKSNLTGEIARLRRIESIIHL